MTAKKAGKKTAKKSVGRRMRRPKWYPLMVAGIIVLGFVGSVGVITSVRSMSRRLFPDVTVLATRYAVPVSRNQKRMSVRFVDQKPKNWVSLSQIPKSVTAAILLSEDSSFYQHHGYSAEAIWDAWEYNRRPDVKVKRGGSTITQQLVKNLFLTSEKTMTRKVRELLLSVELERKVSKSRILETYLNVVEWGPGIFGIGPASQRYFGKEPSQLVPREAAILAFMLPNPTKYQHSLREDGLTEFGQRRVSEILEKMRLTGHLSDQDVEWTSAESSNALPSDL